MLRKLLRLITFSASTLAGTAVDTFVLWLCAHGAFAGTYWGENIVSPTLSFLAATVANYVMAYCFVWRDRISTRSWSDFMRRYWPYLSTCVGGFLIKMLILQGLVLLISWDVVWLNLVAVCISGLFNFAINEWIVFRPK